MNKTLKSLLIFTVIIISALFYSISANAANTIWDGTIAQKAPDIDSENNYLLKDGKDLAWFASKVNSGNVSFNAKIVNDIYLNNVEGSSYINTWTPIANYNTNELHKYKGIFDGGGYTIYGLYINNSSDYQGLFGYIEGGTISNTNMSGTKINAANYVGSISGYINAAAVIENCKVEGNLTASGSNLGGIAAYCYDRCEIINCGFKGSLNGGTNRIGGITGCLSANSSVFYSYSKAQINSDGKYIGGIVGTNAGSTVNGSYNHGNISGLNRIGGIVGNNAGKIFNSYNVGEITSNGDKGAISGYNSMATVENCYYDKQTCTSIDAFGYGKTTSEMKRIALVKLLNDDGGKFLMDYTVMNNAYPIITWELNEALWTGVATKPKTSPDGQYYLISNGEELCWFEKLVNGTLTDGTPKNSYANARLTKSIILNLGEFVEGSNIWTPIGHDENGYFGTFDGNGNSISGIYITSGNNIGLFGKIGISAAVKNFSITLSNFNGSNTVGCLSGANYGLITGVKISNCTVNGDSIVGGFSGENGGTIRNSSIIQSEVKGNTYIGGFIGKNFGTINTCYNISDVTGTSYVGGLLGDNAGNIDSCFNRGTVTAKGSYVGGIVGNNNGVIALSNCYNTGNVTGISYVGGIAGTTRNSTISKSYNVGKVTGNSLYGAVIGQFYSGQVDFCYYDLNRNSVTDSHATGLTTEQFVGSNAFQYLGGFNPSQWVLKAESQYFIYYPQLAAFVNSEDEDLVNASIESVYFLKYGLNLRVNLNKEDTYYSTLQEAADFIGTKTAVIYIFNSMTMSSPTPVTINGNVTILCEKNNIVLSRGAGNGNSLFVVNGTLNVGISNDSDDYYPLKINGGDKTLTIRGSAIYKINPLGVLNYNEAETYENRTSTNGSAIYNQGTVNLNGGLIRDCKSTLGGAIFNEGELNVNAVKIYGNTAYDSGAAIYTNANGVTNINKGAHVYDNIAATNGGAFSVEGNAKLFVNAGLVSGNTATNNGGAIYNNGTTTISGGEFSQNHASKGKGAYNNKTFNISNGAYMNSENDIYVPNLKPVTMISKSDFISTIITITPQSYMNGLRVVNGSFCALNYKKVAITQTTDGYNWKINSSGRLLTGEIVDVAIMSTFGVYNASYTSLQEAFDDIGTNAAVITIIEDIELRNSISVRSNVTIQSDSQGRTISRAPGFNGDMFVIENGECLILGDYSSEADEDLLFFDGVTENSSGGSVFNIKSGKLVMYNGVVIHNVNSDKGAINVSGEFEMIDGKIISSNFGVILNNGSMIMHDGSISENNTAIYCDGTLTLHSDCAIDTNNHVYLTQRGKIEIAEEFSEESDAIALIDFEKYELNYQVLTGEFVTQNLSQRFEIVDPHYHISESGFLASDTFSLKTTSPLQLNLNQKILTGLDIEINIVNNILTQLSNTNAEIYRPDGTLCSNQEIVGTGYKICLIDERGDIYNTITVVIFGDVDGNGRVDAQDSVLVSFVRNSNFLNLTEHQIMACDVNHDGVLDLSDQWIIEDSAIYIFDILQYI